MQFVLNALLSKLFCVFCAIKKGKKFVFENIIMNK